MFLRTMSAVVSNEGYLSYVVFIPFPYNLFNSCIQTEVTTLFPRSLSPDL